MDLIQNINEIKVGVINNINRKFDSIPQSVIIDIFNAATSSLTYYPKDSKGNVDYRKCLNRILASYSYRIIDLLINTDKKGYKTVKNYTLLGSIDIRTDDNGNKNEVIVIRIKELEKKSIETLIKIDSCYDDYDAANEKKENAARYLLNKLNNASYINKRTYNTDVYFKIIKKDIEGNHIKLRTSRLDSNNLFWSTYIENIEVKQLGDYTFLTSAEMEEIVEKMFNKKIETNKKTISTLQRKNEELDIKKSHFVKEL